MCLCFCQNIFSFAQAAKVETVLQCIFTLLLFWSNIFPFYVYRQYNQTTLRVLYFLKVHVKSCDQPIIPHLLKELENVCCIFLFAVTLFLSLSTVFACLFTVLVLCFCASMYWKTCNDEGHHAGNMTHISCADTEQIGWDEMGRAGWRDVFSCIFFSVLAFCPLSSISWIRSCNIHRGL